LARARDIARGLTVCVATVEVPRSVADERRLGQTQALEDRRWLHDTLPTGRRVAPQSARRCRRHLVAALITATDQFGHASRPDLMRLLRLSPVRMQGLIVIDIGGLRSRGCRPPDRPRHFRAERWIEKSTDWSREDMLCEHRQTIRVVASFMPARPG